MEKQFLLENETVLLQSDSGVITLTDRRLVKNTRSAGDGYFLTIHHQNISSVEVTSKSAPWLIVLAVFSIIGSIGFSGRTEEGLTYVCVAVSIGLILLYLISRHHIVTITSDGGVKLRFSTKGMKRETVLEFVRKIDQAKYNQTKNSTDK